MRARTILLLLGCVLFVYLLTRIGAARILELLQGIGWSFAWVAALFLAHQGIRATIFWYCARIHRDVQYWHLLRIRLSGEAVQFLTFSGIILSLPAQALLLRQFRLTVAEAFAATATDYILFYLTSAAISCGTLIYLLISYDLAGALLLAARIGAWSTGIFLAAASLAIVLRFYLIGTIINAAGRLPRIGHHLRVDPQKLRATEDRLFLVLRSPRRLCIGIALHTAAHALLLIELFVLLRTAAEPFSFSQMLVIEGANKAAGFAFFFIPGQMGAAEGVYALVCEALGLSAATGFTIALARRLRTMLVAGLGLGALSLHKRATGSGIQ